MFLKRKIDLPLKLPNPNCKHLNSEVRGSGTFGFGWCLDCDCEVNLGTIFNNWLTELKVQRKEEEQ